jgi:DNA polymerase-4
VPAAARALHEEALGEIAHPVSGRRWKVTVAEDVMAAAIAHLVRVGAALRRGGALSVEQLGKGLPDGGGLSHRIEEQPGEKSVRAERFDPPRDPPRAPVYPPAVARTILHVDLDAFYASVEQRDDPTLRGRPVIVGGRSLRGVVCAASYEARPFGVRSAMPMVTAMKLCPQAAVIAPRMGHYAAVSHDFFAILGRYSPLVEGLSLDEAFLDVTGEERLLGDGPTIGAAIKRDVRAELGIVASVGVAPCKFAAKIASDLRKPDALVTVDAAGLRDFLRPLPMSRLWGVGKVTEQELARFGLRTIGDVERIGEATLQSRLGREAAQRLCALARGEDDRAVVPDRAPVSVGSEETFEQDLHSVDELEVPIIAHADRACRRLRHLAMRAHVVTLKVKYGDHELVTRRTTLERPTADGRAVAKVARALCANVPAIASRGVRLAGVSLSGLVAKDGARQLLLDEKEHERGEQLGDTLDKIAGRFGGAAITRAALLPSTTPRKR